jgi:hypothetical protein
MDALSTEILGELHMAIVLHLLKPTDISLRVFSLVQLYTAIYLRVDIFDTAPGGRGREGVPIEVAQSPILQWFQRPTVHRSMDSVTVHYDMAISPAIAASWGQPPLAIAEWLQNVLLQALSPPTGALDPDAVWLQVELRITDQGWLRWSWSAVALLAWMDQAARSIAQWPLPSIALADQTAPELWRCLHAYARCAAWLSQAPVAAPVLGPLEPDALTWSRLGELMAVIDRLADMRFPPPADLYLRAATTAAQAFEALDRAGLHRETELVCPFRLGLVMLIKSLLGQLLSQGLGLKTAEEI